VPAACDGLNSHKRKIGHVVTLLTINCDYKALSCSTERPSVILTAQCPRDRSDPQSTDAIIDVLHVKQVVVVKASDIRQTGGNSS
jgi:hypothetical protein